MRIQWWVCWKHMSLAKKIASLQAQLKTNMNTDDAWKWKLAAIIFGTVLGIVVINVIRWWCWRHLERRGASVGCDAAPSVGRDPEAPGGRDHAAAGGDLWPFWKTLLSSSSPSSASETEVAGGRDAGSTSELASGRDAFLPGQTYRRACCPRHRMWRHGRISRPFATWGLRSSPLRRSPATCCPASLRGS
jgi:hypothetical protein